MRTALPIVLILLAGCTEPMATEKPAQSEEISPKEEPALISLKPGRQYERETPEGKEQISEAGWLVIPKKVIDEVYDAETTLEIERLGDLYQRGLITTKEMWEQLQPLYEAQQARLVKYMDEHPESLHESVDAEVLDAYRDRFGVSQE